MTKKSDIANDTPLEPPRDEVSEPKCGLKKGKWGKVDNWSCSECGFSTTVEAKAKSHTCNK